MDIIVYDDNSNDYQLCTYSNAAVELPEHGRSSIMAMRLSIPTNWIRENPT